MGGRSNATISIVMETEWQKRMKLIKVHEQFGYIITITLMLPFYR